MRAVINSISLDIDEKSPINQLMTQILVRNAQKMSENKLDN